MRLSLYSLSLPIDVLFSKAFVPSARRCFGTQTDSVTGTLRRPRLKKSGDAGIAMIEKFQREQGLYRDFQYGAFVSAVEASTTSEPQIAQLPSVFPLEGKNPSDAPPRMRFAPSPTGSLHVGGARTALYNWLVAKKGQLDQPKSNAAFVLRVEDTDVARSTKGVLILLNLFQSWNESKCFLSFHRNTESENSVLADLSWLGLQWDEGPDMVGCPYGPYRQSERSDIYFAAAQRLIQEGKAYRCFATEEELEEMKAAQEARGEIPQYDGRWRNADIKEINRMLDQEMPYTVRFKVPENSRVVIDDVVRGTVSWDAQATVGDFILLRSSGVPVYNFCVAVDDAAMGITTVVRAEEHLTNTVRQALVLDALNAPRPRYAHCSLILGEDKQKLSKRHGATSCDQYRKDGFLPDAMINYLALLGWNDGTDNEIFTRDELIDAFQLERVVKSPSVFDVEKLKWVNGQHIKRMTVEDIAPLVKQQIQWANILKDGVNEEDPKLDDFVMAATSIAKQMMETTKDAVTNAKAVLSYNLPHSYFVVDDIEAKEMIQMGHFYPLAMRILEQYESGTFPTPDADPLAAFRDAVGQAIEEDSQKGASCQYTQDYMAYMKQIAKEMGIKGRNLFHPLRLMLTGEMSGQDVTKQLSLLKLGSGPDSVIDNEKAGVVEFSERMSRLKDFCKTIPEEFRVARLGATAAATRAESSVDENASVDQSLSASNPSRNFAIADPKSTYTGPPISALDIRVGYIRKVWEHTEAEKLYCEEIDVGEEEPRQIASGLRPYLKAEDLEGRKVLVLCNLKSRNLVGFPSHGMVLCASNADHTVVRLVNPPIDAKIGERVTVPDFDFATDEGAPFAENKIAKKKVFEEIAPHLVTNQYGVPEFLGRPFMTSAGVCTSSIPDGSVS
jgi:glutamyl-tRNA synthetase